MSILCAIELAFVGAQRIGHLATADADGRPHVVPVCFALDPDAVYVAIDEKPKGRGPLKRLRNIEANPSVAFVVDRYDEDWTRLGWVLLRGRAAVLRAGDEVDTAVRLLRARYPQYANMTLSPVIAIRIEHATSWGSLGTG